MIKPNPPVVPDWKLIILLLRRETGFSYTHLSKKLGLSYHSLNNIRYQTKSLTAMQWITGQILIAAARTELTDEQLTRCRVEKL